MNINKALAGAVMAIALASGSTAMATSAQPSRDWSGNWEHLSPNEKQYRLNAAKAVKQAEDGGYGPGDYCIMMQEVAGAKVDVDADGPASGPDSENTQKIKTENSGGVSGFQSCN